MQMNFNNKQIEVEEVEVLQSNEPWSEYQLADGSLLSHKTVLISAFRALTEKNPDGTVVYLTRTQNVVKVREARKS